MNSEQIYPKNIEKLQEKLNYIVENDENEEKVEKIKNWLKWFNSLNYNIKYICKKNEYLKIYSDNNNYSLQIWQHNKDVDSIKFTLLSNYYSEYDNEITEIIE